MRDKEEAGRQAAATAYARACGLLRSYNHHPKMVVVDLDYTLWRCYVECFGPRDNPPVYPEVLDILKACHSHGIKLAVASKSPATETGSAWLRRLAIFDHFSSVQIFSAPGKLKHFANIKKDTGIALADMLFFDDESPNIRTMSQQGVTCIHVPSDGLDMLSFERGLEMHASKTVDDRGFGLVE